MSAIQREGEDFDIDKVVSVIKSPRRRRLIEIVSQYEEITLRDASEIIAAEDNGIDRESVTWEERRPAYSPLYQHHLPVLVECGILDEEDNVLRATDVTHDVAELIDVLDGVEIGGARA